MEIDLGHLTTDGFVKEIEERFPDAFRDALGEVLEAQANLITLEQELPEQGSPIELLSYYLRTGMLPWWVEQPSNSTIPDALEVLLHTRTPTLRQLLVELIPKSAWLTRLIRDVSEPQLVRLTALLVPDRATFSSEYASTIEGLLPALAANVEVSSQQLRIQHWRAVFQTLHWERLKASGHSGFVKAVWLHTAELAGVELAQLAPALLKQLDQQVRSRATQPSRTATEQAIASAMQELGSYPSAQAAAAHKAAGTRASTNTTCLLYTSDAADD